MCRSSCPVFQCHRETCERTHHPPGLESRASNKVATKLLQKKRNPRRKKKPHQVSQIWYGFEIIKIDKENFTIKKDAVDRSARSSSSSTVSSPFFHSSIHPSLWFGRLLFEAGVAMLGVLFLHFFGGFLQSTGNRSLIVSLLPVEGNCSSYSCWAWKASKTPIFSPSQKGKGRER